MSGCGRARPTIALALVLGVPAAASAPAAGARAAPDAPNAPNAVRGESPDLDIVRPSPRGTQGPVLRATPDIVTPGLTAIVAVVECRTENARARCEPSSLTVHEWSVNGKPGGDPVQTGTITRSTATRATYRAPSHANWTETFAIRARVTGRDAAGTLRATTLVAPITITPGQARYAGQIKMTRIGPNHRFEWLADVAFDDDGDGSGFARRRLVHREPNPAVECTGRDEGPMQSGNMNLIEGPPSADGAPTTHLDMRANFSFKTRWTCRRPDGVHVEDNAPGFDTWQFFPDCSDVPLLFGTLRAPRVDGDGQNIVGTTTCGTGDEKQVVEWALRRNEPPRR